MKRIIIIFFVFILVPGIKAQNNESYSVVGAGVEMYYSVNGHGAFYSPHISYSKNKHSLKLGPCIHKRSLKLSGAKLSYAFMLAGMDGEEQTKTNFRESSNGTWRVSLFTYGQFIDFTGLSYKRQTEEALLNEGGSTDWGRVCISTLEGGFGAEIDVKLLNYFQCRTYVGIAVYSHMNQPEFMYQDKTAAAFIMGVGVNIPSFKKKKKEK